MTDACCKARALVLVHVPLVTEFPNGFAARWLSFLRELQNDFDLDIISVRGIWDLTPISDPDRVPESLGACRVRIVAARMPQRDPPAAWRVLRMIRNLGVIARIKEVAPGLEELRDMLREVPPPALVIAFLHHMAEPVLRSGVQAPVVFVLEEGVERLPPPMLPQLGTGRTQQAWRRVLVGLRHIKLRELARSVVSECGRRGTIVAINDEEAAYFSAVSPRAKVKVVPLGVDTSHYAPAQVEKDIDVGVFGDFSQARNYRPARALYDLATDVAGADSLRWAFVGRSPHDSIRLLASEKVVISGSVPDVRPYYARTRVVAVPGRSITGTKTSLLKACAMGCAVVVLEDAVVGIPAAVKEHLIVVSDMRLLIKRMVELIKDSSGSTAIGARLRAAIVQSCSQEVFSSQFRALCLREALARPDDPPTMGGTPDVG